MSVETDTLEARCEEFSKFTGEWLLLSGDQLLAHSQEFRDIQAVIKDRQLKDCFVHYVPLLSEQDFILL
jgi:hypothetical protein